MSEWIENFENDIKVQIEGVKHLEAGYVNVRLLNNSAKKIDEYALECDICKQFKSDYEAILPKVVERVKDAEFRDMYEKKLVEVSKHLENIHGIMPKRYYASLYTLIGIVLGLFLGYVLMYFINPDLLYTGLFYGGIIGIVTGRLLGLRKDKKLTLKGKTF
jgi:tetrahydromethanopterin S-methyltransferase subunit G